jgi:hypothetical protein
MSCDIVQAFGKIVASPHNLPVMHDYGTHRHFAQRCCLCRFLQGYGHEALVALLFSLV